ncbi:MAG: hypothetical protein DDT28_00138 [Dehalococcoidia bacterium]|nr:hypothetical protein [Chloroflexota bacterium]MBT9166366.1 hypothetical protein [Chloroflexota bacterium]
MGKILLVDDDPEFVEITRIILESNGYEVSVPAMANRACRPCVRINLTWWCWM